MPQEPRLMRFEKAYGVWRERRLTQVGAQLLRTCERAFRSHVDRRRGRWNAMGGGVDGGKRGILVLRVPFDRVSLGASPRSDVQKVA